VRIWAIGVAAILAFASQGMAQTRNATTKTTTSSEFQFPNDCTGELLDVTSRTVVTCHDQARADGTLLEKCAIHEEVSALAEGSGTEYQGSSDFKSEIVGTDPCNFGFINRGGVRLISPGSDVNLVLGFEDLVRMESCVLTTDVHLFSADCRGAKP
jgi:hypothetical protein